jgi:hypothetical protein
MANEKAARVSRLFLSTVEFNGKPVSSVKKGFRSAVRLAGLPGKVTPHTLRHIGCDLADAARRADLPSGSLDALKVAPATLLDHGGQQPEFPKKKKSKTKPRPK